MRLPPLFRTRPTIDPLTESEYRRVRADFWRFVESGQWQLMLLLIGVLGAAAAAYVTITDRLHALPAALWIVGGGLVPPLVILAAVLLGVWRRTLLVQRDEARKALREAYERITDQGKQCAKMNAEKDAEIAALKEERIQSRLRRQRMRQFAGVLQHQSATVQRYRPSLDNILNSARRGAISHEEAIRQVCERAREFSAEVAKVIRQHSDGDAGTDRMAGIFEENKWFLEPASLDDAAKLLRRLTTAIQHEHQMLVNRLENAEI